jgi:hypothetical protein
MLDFPLDEIRIDTWNLWVLFAWKRVTALNLAASQGQGGVLRKGCWLGSYPVSQGEVGGEREYKAFFEVPAKSKSAH